MRYGSHSFYARIKKRIKFSLTVMCSTTTSVEFKAKEVLKHFVQKQIWRYLVHEEMCNHMQQYGSFREVNP